MIGDLIYLGECEEGPWVSVEGSNIENTLGANRVDGAGKAVGDHTGYFSSVEYTCHLVKRPMR